MTSVTYKEHIFKNILDQHLTLMKMNVLLLVVLFFIIFPFIEVWGQVSWAPTGAKWHFDYNYNYGNATSYVTVESIGDTVIQGINCKTLRQECQRNDEFSKLYFTYKNDDKVWIFDGNNFRLLYDFSLNAGDTMETYGRSLYSTLDCDSITTAYVESVGYEEINGITFKYLVVSMTEFGWYFGEFGSGTYKISEKFGSYGYLLPQTTCGGADFDLPSTIRCYEDDEVGFFSPPFAYDCDYEEGVGVQNIDFTDDIRISPNPVIDDLTIGLKGNIIDSRISIYTQDGRIVFTMELMDEESKIDLSGIKSGLYFIRVFHNNRYAGGKFLKL